jgi:hypothetical protein
VSQVVLDGVVLVATPQCTALLDTLRSYHMFRNAGVPIVGRVENMATCSAPLRGEHRPTEQRRIRRLPACGRPANRAAAVRPVGRSGNQLWETGRPNGRGCVHITIFGQIADGVDTFFATE